MTSWSSSITDIGIYKFIECNIKNLSWCETDCKNMCHRERIEKGSREGIEIERKETKVN